MNLEVFNHKDLIDGKSYDTLILKRLKKMYIKVNKLILFFLRIIQLKRTNNL